MMIKYTLWAFMLSAFLVSLTVEAKNTWKLSKQADGIDIYVRTIANSKFKSFKGVATFPARLTSLVAVLEDTNVFPRLFHKCKSAKSIKKVGDFESYNYLVMNMPWPLKDRDSIVYSVLQQNKQSKAIKISINARPKMIKENKKRVRIHHMNGSWLFVPLTDGKVKVTYELTLAPEGNLPAWAVNMLAVDFPFYTMKNIRRLAKLPIYNNARRRYIID